MIGISAKVYDIDGARIFPEAETSSRKGARRVTRVPTLDGGVSVNDSGYTDGDREVYVEEAFASLEAVDFAQYICETYGLVTVTTQDGAYTGIPESYRIESDGTLSIKMLLTEKIS